MKKNMNDFWHYPENKEDKAEYKRMRKEWQKLQQQKYSNSSETRDYKKSSKAKWVVCLCAIFIFAAWVFNNGSALKFDRFLENEIVVSEFGTLFKSGKKVSYRANIYLQQDRVVTLKWTKIVTMLNTGQKDLPFDEIDLLLKEIEILNKTSIPQYDDLKSYEVVCEAYFGCIYSFLSSVKEKQAILSDDYNSFAVEINSLENPYNHLIELFDEYGYYYYIDSDKEIHYKFNNSLF